MTGTGREGAAQERTDAEAANGPRTGATADVREAGSGAREAGAEASADAPPSYRLVDMHCHLDRMRNAEEVAQEAQARGIALFGVTVTPVDAQAARERLGGIPSVRIGVGLHPWWLAEGRCTTADAATAARLAVGARFIGEVGLDGSPRYREHFDVQRAAFEGIVRTCADAPLAGRVLSIHAVKSAGAALDILERYDLPRHAACIFHWFSGTGEDLVRLRRLGCLVSVNERMLGTRRGRAYVRQLPARQLLLETDAPPELDAPYRAEALEVSLTRTLAAIAELRGENPAELGRAMAATSMALLGIEGAARPLPPGAGSR